MAIQRLAMVNVLLAFSSILEAFSCKLWYLIERRFGRKSVNLQELLEAVKQSMPVPFRVDGPPLVYEFDEWPQIDDDGTYLDEQPPPKRKRVDGDDEEGVRKKRPTAGAKGSAKNVSNRQPLF